MLREISRSQKTTNGMTRRWFTNEKFDLFVFIKDDNQLAQLQLCYDKHHKEHVIAWSEKYGYEHAYIDTGRNMSGRAGSPVFTTNGLCDIDEVKRSFIDTSLNLDNMLFDQIYRKLVGYKLGIEF